MPKVSELEELTSVASTDTVPVVDVSAGTTKKATVANLVGAMLPLSTANGGTGLSSIGSSGQFLKVNGAGTALEYGAGAAAPTGTGLAKVTAGAFDAAASKLLNADVDAAAAIAGSKISPDFGAQNIVTTGYVSAGASPATTGTFRAPNNDGLYCLNQAGNATHPVAYLDTANRAVLGNGGGSYLRVTPGGGDGGLSVSGEFIHNVGAGQEHIFKVNNTRCFGIGVNGIQIGPGAADFGGGTGGILGIDNATANPSTNPTNGVVIYADAGAAKVRGSGGTVTTFGPADLDGFKGTVGDGHCPSCGTDFALEWANEQYGSLTVCMRCLAEELGDRPWIVKKRPRAA